MPNYYSDYVSQDFKVHYDARILEGILEELRPNAAKIVQEYGETIRDETSAGAPVDKGDLQKSYMEESKMTDELTYTVSDGVEYGIFQELGTSRMAAQPHLIPAIENNAGEFADAFEELIK